MWERLPAYARKGYWGIQHVAAWLKWRKGRVAALALLCAVLGGSIGLWATPLRYHSMVVIHVKEDDGCGGPGLVRQATRLQVMRDSVSEQLAEMWKWLTNR